jgi:hypothetical protein
MKKQTLNLITVLCTTDKSILDTIGQIVQIISFALIKIPDLIW